MDSSDHLLLLLQFSHDFCCLMGFRFLSQFLSKPMFSDGFAFALHVQKGALDAQDPLAGSPVTLPWTLLVTLQDLVTWSVQRGPFYTDINMVNVANWLDSENWPINSAGCFIFLFCKSFCFEILKYQGTVTGPCLCGPRQHSSQSCYCLVLRL